jgi:hypothetical protein
MPVGANQLPSPLAGEGDSAALSGVRGWRENQLIYPPHPLALRRESPLPLEERVVMLLR